MYVFGYIPNLSAQSVEIKEDRPKVAVVLSGGGAKGFAHVGVLKVLEQEGIPIDIVVGTSMGSLIGGIYALGYNAVEMEQIIRQQNWDMLLRDKVNRQYLSINDRSLLQRYFLSYSFIDRKSDGLPQGAIRGQNVLNTFCGLSANLPHDADFSKLPVEYACVATDLKTGEEVVLKDGFLPTALFASMAIPGVFQAAKRGNLMLVDGGLVNNFPVDVAKDMGADIIIGVDLRDSTLSTEKLGTIAGVFNQMVNFLMKSKDSTENYCNIFIHPDISGYSVGSFSSEAADTLMRRGEEAALAQLEQIRQLKKKYKLQARIYSRELVENQEWLITDITYADNKFPFFDKTFLARNFGLNIPKKYTEKELKTAIDKLYAYGMFDLVYYDLSDNPTGKTLNLTTVPKRADSQQIGFKANTHDAAALLLNLTRRDYQDWIGFSSLDVELSANPGIKLIAETIRKDLPIFGIELNVKYQEYKIYEGGKKLFNADLFYTSAKLYTYRKVLGNLYMGGGVQEEYYNGDIFLREGNPVLQENQYESFLTNSYFKVAYDNMDDFYFPTHGTRTDAEFTLNADFSEKDQELSYSLLFRTENVIPVFPRTCILLNLYSRTLFNENFPLFKTTFVGGASYTQYFNYHLPFWGLPPVTIAERYANIGLAGVRLQLFENHYVSVMCNFMVQGNDWDEIKNFDLINGGGIKYAAKTPIGPFEIGFGYASNYEKLTFSANLGMWF